MNKDCTAEKFKARPGIFLDLPNENYHASPALGSSGLKLLAQTPAHYFAAYLDPNREPRKETLAFKIGKAWHTAVYEPAEFDNRYVAMPDGIDRRTKEGKALWAEIVATGKIPLPAGDMDRILRMGRAANTHPATRVLFAQKGLYEASIFFTDPATGVLCKFRPDFMVMPCDLFPNGLIIDGKSCEDASPEGFARQAWNYEMHYQAALYSGGFQQHFKTRARPEFLWLAQEKEAPYACAIYSATADLVNYGRRKIRPLLELYARCAASGVWPGYSTAVTELGLPAWAAKIVQDELQAGAP